MKRRSELKKVFVTFLVFTLILSTSLIFHTNGANTTRADEVYQWASVNNGLHGGIIHSLSIDPTNTNIIYAGTEKGVFKYTSQFTIILHIGNKTFTVNGESRTLDSPPIIKNGRTLLPIRAVIEALNGSVSWDASTKKVTVSLGSTTIELWIGKSIAKVNGADVHIDSANPKVVPEIINSRTYLPIRFISENLGATVDWDSETQTITIYYWL